MRRTALVPDRGDAIWVDFTPQAGREQRGQRPAVVLSPAEYNDRVGLAICCPVTSQAKGYPFEVRLPAGLPIEGVVLADHVKSLDWRARGARRVCRLPVTVTDEILAKLAALLG